MWIMPQLALQNIIQSGLREIKANPAILDDIFGYMYTDELSEDYGEDQVNKIRTWFLGTKVPVLHAWTFNADRIPCISIHLADESEDESKTAVGDYLGVDEVGEVGVTPLATRLDIGIHASKSSDEVLWLYYIVTYILFKKKRYAEELGLYLQTFTASDWDKRPEYLVENIWTRWMRFRCTTYNYWESNPYTPIDDVGVDLDVESEGDIELAEEV